MCPSLAVCMLPRTTSEPVYKGLQGRAHLPLRTILLDTGLPVEEDFSKVGNMGAHTGVLAITDTWYHI